ncbi:uncharacterized protein B0T15DRAFT_220830 [Chaetomium strumarium]|uniref:C2H2-type domain-containing protein n=1 Tax=Chaetomium strumarium TaxID=1170767 RepID=A0AAJ0M260_9PEZI|nr:hypothetical protein B0T15DRAFT_220830 [Chaetomium strumarium]
MDTSYAPNTVVDAELDSQFSHLTMDSSQVDPNINHSAPWLDQTTTFSPNPGAGDLGPQYLPDNTLASPMSAQQTSTDPYPYHLDSASYHIYHPPDDSAAQAGPSSSFSNATAADYPFICDQDGCNKGFERQCDLTKHKNNHSKRRKCKYCDAGGAETKDLNRHMWTHHPDLARELGVPRELDRCSKCGYAARKDNVKRHKDKKGHW